MAETGKLSATQHRAVAALIAVGTTRAAAQMAGVGERTLHRWLQEDENFRTALIDAQGRAVQHHVTALIAQLDANRQAMVNIRDSGQHESTRLRAAIAIDDSLRQWRSLAEFEDRIARLERSMSNEA